MPAAQVKEFIGQSNCEVENSKKAPGKHTKTGTAKVKWSENSNIGGDQNSNSARADLN
ncbi:MAG: hypothetical protein ACK521_08920 [bacterium]